jgi:hypothetical protein
MSKKRKYYFLVSIIALLLFEDPNYTGEEFKILYAKCMKEN